ncbi:MAG: ATPase [Acidobacteria bacterium]|nr:ATPase [Acidobacteriota bacterium]
MSKVQVLGPRRLLPRALQVLHGEGVLQIRSLPDGPRAALGGDGRRALRVVPLVDAERAAERALADIAGRLQELLVLLPAPDRITGGADEGLPDDVAAPEFGARLAPIEAEVRAFSARRDALQAERDLAARYARLLTALAPLRRALPAGEQVTTLGILLRRDRAEILHVLEREVRRMTSGACVLLSGNVDREQIGVLLTVPREAAPAVSRFLFERGIAEIRLPERYTGQSLLDALLLLTRRSQELPAEIREAEAGLMAISRRWHRPFTAALQAARSRRARLAAMASCGETDHAFVIYGWVPAEQRVRLTAALDAAFEGRVMVVDHPVSATDYDDVPVVLRNPPYVRAFEPLVGFVAWPRYGSIDPTPFVAGFFPLFFGVMLGDVGFGGLALALTLLARLKGWGGEIGRQLTTIALASSMSAIAFGVLFGELFGALGEPLGLHPILFDRRTAALSFLAMALLLGVCHVVLGISLSLWSALRHHHEREALARAVVLALIAAAILAGLAHVGYVPSTVERPALVALALLAVATVFLGGAIAAIELVSTLGNILSYARLMALGTASVMLAEVANRMVEIFSSPVVGVTAAVTLHAVNFAMGLFSPTIQALRLHYVEFFDKFFEGGGKPYEPFALTNQPRGAPA